MGVWGAWREFRAHSRAAWLLPIALVGTALVQAHILGYYPTWSHWLTPVVVAGAALGSAVLLYALIRDRLQHNSVIIRAATGLATGALLVAPVVWSGYSTLNGSSFGLPSAGPQVANAYGGFGGPGGAPPNIMPSSSEVRPTASCAEKRLVGRTSRPRSTQDVLAWSRLDGLGGADTNGQAQRRAQPKV